LRVLVANFFPAFHPPRSGGEQRYHCLYRHLSRHFDVTLLSPTHYDHPFEEVRFSPTFRELRVPKAAAFDRLHWDLDAKGIGPECSGCVVALASGVESEYGAHFAAASADADIVIHESPFTLPYDRAFGIDGKPRVYNAYNVEHRLAREILEGDAGARAAEFIAFLERKLAQNAALLFATSGEDRALLASDFGVPIERIAIAPNGFEPDGVQSPLPVAREVSTVVFLGSAHPPNVEAARFIVERVAPELPNVQVRILGAVCDKLRKSTVPQNVRLLGIVDDVVKRRELARCALALNPMFSGSGTNLKMLDYLASGAPVITTPIGARGLGLVDGIDAFIAHGDDFAVRVRQALDERALRERVAAAGTRKAYSQFTWEQIADRFRVSIEAMFTSRRETSANQRPLLLHVNDFGVADGAGGGEVRIRELLLELGREFEVVLLCLTNETMRSEQRLGPHVLEIRIPKTLAHRDAEVVAARGESVSIDDVIASEFCTQNDAFVSSFRTLGRVARAVVFEHPYLSSLLALLPDDMAVVYSALNVESRLKLGLLRGRRDATCRIAQVRDLERAMVRRAMLTVCVSDDDRRVLCEEFGERECVVIENGVRNALRMPSAAASDQRARSKDRFLGVFLGSAHPPNAEAARFLIDVLAHAVPELDIVIIGSVCSALGVTRASANVHLVGIVSEAEKNAILARADVALNPMFQGGGSSLKVPDFLAAGLPMISTRTGARGYVLENGRHYIEADRETFADRTRALLRDSALRRRMGAEAHDYAVRALDWNVLGRRYRRAIDSLIGRKAKPRVLVVTYRFADPPPGGAETFLARTVQALHARGNVIVDIAACDVATIAHKWHFSAEYASNAAAVLVPSYVDSLFRFALDEPSRDDFERCRELFQLWMRETGQQARALVDEAAPVLLGGWNFPERGGGSIRRWTSARSDLQVGRTAKELRIVGDAPTNVVAEIHRDGKRVAMRTLDGRFDWRAPIGNGGRVISLMAQSTCTPVGDPRELGFVVDAIEWSDGTTWRALPLEVDFELVVRRDDDNRWVRSLIELAQARADEVDRLFYLVRGPHSIRLAHWLERNVASYDVVLVHGTPFSTPVLAARIAANRGVPVVCLPHFHMEDRYYHWRFYYEMFRSARYTIAAPESSKHTFFDRIGANAVIVPGGGVEPHEFREEVLAAGERAFTRVHRATTPFVLVLGRKTGAKNYRLAIDAMAKVNAEGHRVDLVLIGPDEDGVPIGTPNAFCYGAQDRSVVLGALSQALCLVNMSESESFGIVLLESWLAGRPVIAQRNCTAFRDLVVDDENGLLVETSAELAGAIERYLRDPACADRHARAGRRVAERHAWSRIAEQIERILIEASGATCTAAAATPSIPEPARITAKSRDVV